MPRGIRAAGWKRFIKPQNHQTNIIMKIILTLCTLAIAGALSLNAADEPKKPGGDKPKLNPEEMFKKLDKNGDGSISKEEFLASPGAKKDPAKAEERFKKLDKNGDGKLSLDEFKAGGPKKKPESK